MPVNDGDVLTRQTAARAWNRFVTAVFGDRVGVAVFLGALAFFFAYWRIGILVTDNYTIANTMVAVADGHLHVDRIVYGPESGNQPGMHIVDGRLYGRNFGHVFLSLPFLWILEAAAAVADVRILVAGVWSLLVLGLALQVGVLVDQREEFALLGGAGALSLFAVNAAFATPIDPRWHPVIALQLSTMVAAGLVGVVLYRLLSRLHDRRVGAFAGAVVVLATPVGFWASNPKRHAVTALLALVALYGFTVSRERGPYRTVVTHRALAYAAVGITAWIHAAEAFVLFAVLVPLDLSTARSNDRRQLLVVGAAFFASLVPFFLTNALIAGNPLEPPRLWPSYAGESDFTMVGDGGSGSSGEDGIPGSSRGLWETVLALVVAILARSEQLIDFTIRGVDAVVADPSRLGRTFIRGGYIQSPTGEAAMNLTVLESTPILGVILAIPIVAGHRFAGGVRSRVRMDTPRRRTDLFATGYVVVLTMLYMSRLPLHAQFTVRYLLPIVPMFVYGVARIPAVRRVVGTEGRWLAWAYALLVVICGQVAVVGLVVNDFSFGEVMQLHALGGLVAAGIVAAWLTVDTFRDGMDARIGAVALAFAMAVATVFLILSGWKYFPAGDLALPFARVVNDAIAAG